MGLNARLLAGLSVLVFAAIASTGWLTLEVARGRLLSVEEERARAMGEAAANLLGGMREGFSQPVPPAGAAPGRARLDEAARGLVGVGGVEEVVIVDALQHPLVGDPGGDAGLQAALAGGGAFTRLVGGVVSVYAPIRSGSAGGGGVLGALRLRVAIGEALGEAVRGGASLLAALTLVEGGL